MLICKGLFQSFQTILLVDEEIKSTFRMSYCNANMQFVLLFIEDASGLHGPVRIDPSQFMLSKEPSRLRSFPVLSEAADRPAEIMLPRSPEVEDIPEKVNLATVAPYPRLVSTLLNRCVFKPYLQVII